MKINQKKLERQEIGVHKFINSSKYGSPKDRLGTLNYSMGVGKTYAAILVIKYLFKHKEQNHFVIIVPSERVKDQWKDEINLHFSKKDQLFIEIYTINWVISNGNFIQTITLILDEVHEYTSEKYIQVINGAIIGKQEMLCLTATADNVVISQILRELCPVIDIIDEKEAIESGFTSNFVEYNIPIKLTEDERTEYDKHTKVISESLSKFGNGGLPLANKCLGGGKHKNGKKYTSLQFAFGWAAHNGWHKNLDLTNDRDKKINDLWNPHKIIGYAIKGINAIRHRKNILYSCTNKVTLTLEIVKKFDDIKTIIFSESTTFADKVGLLINEHKSNDAVVYHSQLQSVMMPSEKTGKLIKYGKTRLRKRAIDRIIRGLSRVVVTARSLDKGFNVEDIRMAVTASGSQNPDQYRQRGGRAKRKEESMFAEDIIVLIINIFAINTQDEVWLKKRQSKSDHTIHHVSNIDDIVFKPKSNFDIY